MVRRHLLIRDSIIPLHPYDLDDKDILENKEDSEEILEDNE